MAINESKQRLEFGGFNWVSAFYGWLVAMAVTALLTALLAAGGASVALTQGVNAITENVTGAGLLSALLLLLAMAVAYYAGGYVAGRMSRFDGGRQGVGVWNLGRNRTGHRWGRSGFQLQPATGAEFAPHPCG